VILTASSIITMDPAVPRAAAIAFDAGTGVIAAVGSLETCVAAAPGAEVRDLGDTVLMPGFVEPHSHPVVSGIVTRSPSIWIAPYVGFPSWDDVVALFAKLDGETPAGQPLLFNGLDRLLQGAPSPTAVLLDGYFPSRPVVIADNSGHLAYFNTATMALQGWDASPPPDPVGGSFGRTPDERLDGRAYELPAVLSVAGPVIAAVVTHPLHSAAEWYRYMASFGITSTSDMTYDLPFWKAYQALASLDDCPLRVSLYHVSTSDTCGDPLESPFPDRLRKQGIKLWADGSPWIGNAALSFPYLDTDVVRKAEIPLGPAGVSAMNYTPEELDAVVDAHAPQGWQLAFHCNGDAAFDVVLDVYERGLTKHGLLGTDHRWRVEHLGACRKEQFERAAALGVEASMGPFQFIYWGDLLDGTMFPSGIGSQWQAIGDAFDAGLEPSFHNDGSVTPPDVLLNIQSMVTRTTISGTVHGLNQKLTLDQALRAVTVNGARQLFVGDRLGSLEAGKVADLVELSADPYAVDPATLATEVTVRGTWVGGHRIDLDAFHAGVEELDPTPHRDLARSARQRCCG
jgi:predicted amidohydrolase YtcJ